MSALGFGMVFAVPSVWAYLATGSVNEAVLVTTRVSPPEMFAASVPSMGFLVVAVMYGTAFTALIPALILFRHKPYRELGKLRRTLLVAAPSLVAAAAALALFVMYEERVLITSPWLAGLPAGLFLGAAVVLLAVSVTDKVHSRGPSSRRAEASEYLAFASMFGLIFAVASGLSPLPVVSVLDADGDWHAGQLVEVAPEGVWLIERRQGDAAGEVVLIDGDLLDVVVYSVERARG